MADRGQSSSGLHRCALRAEGDLLASGPLRYNEFLSWAKGNGITRPQQKSTFKRNLQSSGFVIDHGNRGDEVKGLSLR
jgi:hypothetical protein